MKIQLRILKGLVIVMILSLVSTTGNAQTWDGSTSTDWDEPTNWSNDLVPTDADNVVIPNVTNDPIITNGTAALAKSVVVQGGAVLTIENGGSLTIDGSPGVGLSNNGSVQNYGNISLGATTNIGSTAIVNGGSFRNYPDGSIQVDGTNRPFNAGYGIQNNGGRTFINEGSIVLGLNKKVGRSAIFNRGNFRNDTGGQVQIEACDIGIFVASGSINNSGTITIGSVKAPGTNGIESESTFNNNEGGVLNIGKNGSWSIFTTFGSTFNNRGVLTTGSIARGFRGIFTANNFTNFATGTIQCEASTGEAIKVNSGNFRNLGAIKIGVNTRPNGDGLVNLGTVTNEEEATIQIEGAGGYGINNLETMVNKGKITVGLTNQPNRFGYRGIGSSFNNTACGEFIINDNFEVRVSSSFTNNGLLIVDTNNPHTKDGSPFTNNGILAYQQSVFIPGVINREIIIRPTTATGCAPISSAFLLNQVNFNFLGVFSDEDATTSAGIYTQGNNAFVDNPDLADGVTHTLYVSIKDPSGDCTRSVPWKLTIDDTTPPTFTCPSDRTVDVAAGTCQGEVPDFSTIVTDAADNCGNVVIGQDVTAYSTFGSAEGDQIVVTITADDGNGNVNATPCQVTLTVKDNEPPTPSCPSDINSNNDSGQCSAVVNFSVSATDNCDTNVDITYSQNPGTVFNVGTTTVNVTATDDAGNQSGCSFDVVVTDNEPPTATCNDMTLQLNANTGIANFNVFSAGGITNRNDNCGVPSTVGVSGPNVFDCDDVGSRLVTIIYSDINGNQVPCTVTLTIADDNFNCNQPPVAKCQNISVSADLNSCESTITTAQIDNSSSDPDGDPLSFSLDNMGPFTTGGPYTVELTVSDGSLTDKCTATVTVTDDQVPTFSNCPGNISVSNDLGDCGADVAWIPPTFIDNCPGETSSSDYEPGDFFPVGFTTVTYSGSDVAGNDAIDCSFTVTVNDTEAPKFSNCPGNISVSNDLGNCGADVAWTPPTFTDNCPGETSSSDYEPGDFFPVGSTTVTYSGSDVAGNDATDCSFTVTVNDTEAPTFSNCPGNISVSNDLGDCGADVAWTPPTFTDNCPGETSSSDYEPGDFFPVGSTTVTYTGSDAAGNDATDCSFTVTVNDTEAPKFSNCPGNISVSNDLGDCGAIVNWTPPTFDDNCPGAISSSTYDPGDFFPVGSTTVTYSGSDVAGNDATDCSFTVTVNDTEAPKFSNCPGNISVSNDLGNCGADVAWTPPTFTDNCPGETSSSDYEPGDFFPVGSTTVTYSGSDVAGNDATDCSFTVTVNDTEVPTFSNCPDPINLFNDEGDCGAIATWTAPIFEDNCPEATSSSTHTSGDFFPVGTTTVTYSGTDKAGNQAVECSFTVSITDNEKPKIACPGDISTGTDPGVCGAQVNFTPAIANDNCQIDEVKARYRPVDENGGTLGSWTSRVFDPSGFFPVGRYQIQWRAKDIYGNKITCSQYLEVYDDEDPVAACKDLTVDFNGQEDISLTVDQVWNEAASSDNCGFVEFVSANLTIACEDLGNTVAIPVTIKDVTGNTDVCTSYVEVIGLPCDWVEGPSDGSLNCDGQTTSDYDPDEASFTLTSAGCWQSNQNPDQAAFVYQELCGDGSLTAEVSAVNSGGYVGLMARESLDPLARRAGVLKNNSTRRVRREWRPLYDGPVVRTSSNRSRVKWLRIVRQGDQIKSYTSTNGFSWRLLYKVNFSDLEECIYVGMMAYSLNGGTEVEGVFENVSLSGSGTVAGGILGDSSSITPEGLHAWGTAGNIGNGTIDIFPNPASDQTQLVLEDFQDEPAQLMVRDAFGKLVRQIDLNSASGLSMPLDLNNLTPGVYIISLIQDQQLMGSKRLVVQP